MKKSTLLAILVFLSAVAGALGAMFLYLRRREAELEEYERLLFSEDFSYEQPTEAPEAEPAEAAAPAAPAVAAEPVIPAAEVTPAKVAKKAPVKKTVAK